MFAFRVRGENVVSSACGRVSGRDGEGFRSLMEVEEGGGGGVKERWVSEQER